MLRPLASFLILVKGAHRNAIRLALLATIVGLSPLAAGFVARAQVWDRDEAPPAKSSESFPQDAPAALAPAGHAPDEVIVLSNYNGPQFWRVSTGDHEFWILGTIERGLRDPDWDRSVLARIYGETEAVFSDAGGFTLPLGPLAPVRLLVSGPGLVKAVNRITQIPDEGTLAQVVPPDLYARYGMALRNIGEKVKAGDRTRPALAAQSLYYQTLRQARIQPLIIVDAQVRAARGKRRIEWRTPHASIRVKDAKPGLSTFKTEAKDSEARFDAAAEIACLRETLDRLEADVAHETRRAQAWAEGDIEMIFRIGSPAPRPSVCGGAFKVTTPTAIAEAERQANDQWLADILAAPKAYRSALAFIDIDGLWGAEGILTRFENMGYRVEGPRPPVGG